MTKLEQNSVVKEAQENLKQVGSDQWSRKQNWVHYGPEKERVDISFECWREEMTGQASDGKLVISPEKRKELERLAGLRKD
jgi:hypothetical protein